MQIRDMGVRMRDPLVAVKMDMTYPAREICVDVVVMAVVVAMGMHVLLSIVLVGVLVPVHERESDTDDEHRTCDQLR